MIVYKLTSPSGKSYIGKTKAKLSIRMKQHLQLFRATGRPYKGCPTKFFYALEKYPIEQWTKEVLFECDDLIKTNEQEKFFIEHFNTINEGYNISKGGDGRLVDTLAEEHKKAISEKRKACFKTEAGLKWKQELSDKWKGKNNPITNGHPWIGRKHTPETMAIINDKNSKNWLVTDRKGNQFQIRNLSQFCKEKGLFQSNMCKYGHKGFKAVRLDKYQ